MKTSILYLTTLFCIAGCASKKQTGPWIDRWEHTRRYDYAYYYGNKVLSSETRLIKSYTDVPYLYFVNFTYNYNQQGLLTHVRASTNPYCKDGFGYYYTHFYYAFDSARQEATITTWHLHQGDKDTRKASFKTLHIYNTKAQLLQKHVWKVHRRINADSLYNNWNNCLDDSCHYTDFEKQSRTDFRYKGRRLKTILYTYYKETIDSSSLVLQRKDIENDTEELSIKEFRESYNTLADDNDYPFYINMQEVESLTIIPFLKTIKKDR